MPVPAVTNNPKYAYHMMIVRSMQSNQLSGTLPSEWAQLTNLERLCEHPSSPPDCPTVLIMLCDSFAGCLAVLQSNNCALAA